MRGILIAGIAVGLAGALAACVDSGTDRVALDNACGASSMQNHVGQSERVLSGMAFDGPVRIIHPTDPVTMDYSGERLNFHIDKRGVITAVNCG